MAPNVTALRACIKEHPNVKNLPKVTQDMDVFCRLLRENKVNETRDAFFRLPGLVQCLFLYYAWSVLTQTHPSDDAYLTSFRLFKLFRGPVEKNKPIFRPYKDVIDPFYRKAFEWNKQQDDLDDVPLSQYPSPMKTPAKKSSPKSPMKTPAKKSSPTKSPKKTYEKQYQKYETPEDEALITFYTSLYQEKPTSRLAITWLAEYGVETDEISREEIERKYANLVKTGQVFRLRG